MKGLFIGIVLSLSFTSFGNDQLCVNGDDITRIKVKNSYEMKQRYSHTRYFTRKISNGAPGSPRMRVTYKQDKYKSFRLYSHFLTLTILDEKINLYYGESESRRDKPEDMSRDLIKIKSAKEEKEPICFDLFEGQGPKVI